jgi:hypothetical protein
VTIAIKIASHLPHSTKIHFPIPIPTALLKVSNTKSQLSEGKQADSDSMPMPTILQEKSAADLEENNAAEAIQRPIKKRFCLHISEFSLEPLA